MPSILLTKPNATFIHIPNTGGKTVLSLWPNSLKAPTSKEGIPDEWPTSNFKFAFIRHPIDRFVSAFNMFAYGVTKYDKDGKAMESRDPILPNTSIHQFKDLVLHGDDYHAEWSVSWHTIPMTHPHNMLDRADWVGRYERFDNDLESLCQFLGLTNNHLRVNVSNKKQTWKETFMKLSPDDREGVIDFYREDFKSLGYEIPYIQ